ncbi:hypothetical protein EVAR_81359_1 [Eumeta japonica]|uniref:Uncharacterized protein n=1 Tax=Eumeta variegata TaxID=151549 RepID=A0A4C1XAL0_EUMVA|nr:hypothetical protein EVAR_81359_1 [Eumeta japonica]
MKISDVSASVSPITTDDKRRPRRCRCAGRRTLRRAGRPAPAPNHTRADMRESVMGVVTSPGLSVCHTIVIELELVLTGPRMGDTPPPTRCLNPPLIRHSL